MYSEFHVSGLCPSRELVSTLNHPTFQLKETITIRSLALKEAEIPFAWANVTSESVVTFVFDFTDGTQTGFMVILPLGNYSVNSFLELCRSSLIAGLYLTIGPAIAIDWTKVSFYLSPVPINLLVANKEYNGKVTFEFQPGMWALVPKRCLKSHIVFGKGWSTLFQYPLHERLGLRPEVLFLGKTYGQGPVLTTEFTPPALNVAIDRSYFAETPYYARFLPSHLLMHCNVMQTMRYGSVYRTQGGFTSNTVLAKIPLKTELPWNLSQMVYENTQLCPGFMFSSNVTEIFDRLTFWVTDDELNEIDFLGNYFSLTLSLMTD
jgi:hypothetical protein